MGTNWQHKQDPTKLILLISLVLVKVQMAKDLAVLVMSAGELQRRSRRSRVYEATNSVIFGIGKIFSYSSTVNYKIFTEKCQ